MGTEDLEESYRKEHSKIDRLGLLVLSISYNHKNYTESSIAESKGKGKIDSVSRKQLGDSLIEAGEIIKNLKYQYP